MFLYKPVNGRWVLINWDLSFLFGNGDGPTTDLFDVRNLHDSRVIDSHHAEDVSNPGLSARLSARAPGFRQRPLAGEIVGPVLDANYTALIANGASLTGSSGRPTSIRAS